MEITVLILVIVVAVFLFTIRRVPLWVWAIGSLLIGLGAHFRGFDLPFFIHFYPTIVFAILSVPYIRRLLITGPIFHLAKGMLPKISTVERQAAEAGSEGFDAELFAGTPDWDTFRSKYKLVLTEEEEAYLNGPTQELCKKIDDWRVREEERRIPDDIWDFAKKHRFLGLRVSKEGGGMGFSAQAQSIILGTVSSRSLDVSTIVEVPNSLGPDELIEEYGTEEQKKWYLGRFATGEEVPCFAITSPTAGSDAASMRDIGVVTRGTFEGKEVLGINVTWDKRYITLAPKATVITLAFHLFDPEGLLDGEEDRGITLALIPTTHPGVNIGRRHLPSGVVFPNGPTWGNEVFIPLSWVIGGEAGVGEGWKMTMQCLATGRGISLPSMATAGSKLMLRVSTAYARIRRQFNKPIGKIEGIQEVLARLAETAYITESARAVTAAMVTREYRPLVITSILKYQLTEYARRAVNDAMDLHGGRAVIDGPSNYLQSSYRILPVAITVEGANIITRSLIVIGQAALRSHPYFREELEALETSNAGKFDKALVGHISLFVSNIFASFFHNVTFAFFTNGSKGPKQTRYWYRQLARASRNFAVLADTMILLHRGLLKKRQSVSGRLTDALSELYLLSCTLKRFEDDGAHSSDYPVLELCMRNGLQRLDNSMNGIIENVSNTPLRLTLRLVVSPFGRNRKGALDKLRMKVAEEVLNDGEVRDRLTRYIYLPEDASEPIGLLEAAYRKSIEVEDIIVKVEKAIRAGDIERYLDNDWIGDAEKQNIITSKEAEDLREANEMVMKASAVDHFDPKEIHGIHGAHPTS